MSQNFSGLPDVVDATIEVTLIAYQGGKVEVAAKKEDVEFELNYLTNNRKADLRYRNYCIEMGKQILDDPSVQHPAVKMIERLSVIPGNAETLKEFTRPEYNKGNDREYIPDNKRAYLQQFVADQDLTL